MRRDVEQPVVEVGPAQAAAANVIHVGVLLGNLGDNRWSEPMADTTLWPPIRWRPSGHPGADGTSCRTNRWRRLHRIGILSRKSHRTDPSTYLVGGLRILQISIRDIRSKLRSSNRCWRVGQLATACGWLTSGWGPQDYPDAIA